MQINSDEATANPAASLTKKNASRETIDALKFIC
jgi:hypothetical protein